MVKNILRKNLGFIVLAVILAIPLLLVSRFETAIIQQMCVHSLKTLNVIAYILLGLGLVMLLARVITSIVKQARAARLLSEEEREREALRERQEREDKHAKANLNVREPLKDKVIYERLKGWLNEDWGRLTNTAIPAGMSDILRQLDEMNSYQSKLSRLLANNGADYLEDTNAVLESVEQCILKKVRKILNCFVVYESSRRADVEKMETLLNDTRAANAAQLSNVQDFLFAITDFLNKQGDDNIGIEKLELYKKTILESTNDPDEN